MKTKDRGLEDEVVLTGEGMLEGTLTVTKHWHTCPQAKAGDGVVKMRWRVRWSDAQDVQMLCNMHD